MKEVLFNVVQEYLTVFPDEEERQKPFIEFLKKHSNEQIVDWNNFEGHIVAGGFVYAKKEKKFLVVFHTDLKMFLYPGGHMNIADTNPFITALREIKEETGLSNLTQIKITNNPLVPLDLDTQKIGYNKRLQLPEHYHYDFRYLFVIDEIKKIKLDYEELQDYKWIELETLRKEPNYGWIIQKIEKTKIEL